MYLCIYIYVYISIHMYMNIHMYMYMYMYIYIHMCIYIYIYTYDILYLRPYRYTVFEMHFPDTRERPLSLKCFTIVLTTPQMIFLFCFPKKHYNVGPPSYKLAYRHHQDPSRLFKYRYIYYKHYIYIYINRYATNIL